jgi:transcriptional regulator with XRE-family HTH domain
MNPKKNRVSSGVSQLDGILGGLFIGDNVVWYDDAGSLASVFINNFIQKSKFENRSIIFVNFDHSPKKILERLGPLADYKLLTILDCFTNGKGDGSEVFNKFYENKDAQGPTQIVRVNDPGKPDQVIKSIYRLHKTIQGDVRFIFESLTGMQDLWEGEEPVLKFYSRSCPRLYELDTIAYWIIEKGAHSSHLKAHINQIAQVVIELSMKRGKSSLTVLKADRRSPPMLGKSKNYWSDGTTINFESNKRALGKYDLGMVIKEIRSNQGLSQKDLAKAVGVTPSTISQIETNQIYPSLPALIKIAEMLSVEISTLFRGKSNLEDHVVFTRDGENVSFPYLPKGNIKGRQLLPNPFDGKAELYLIEIPPKKKLPAHFFLNKGEEFGYLLSGKLQVVIRNAAYQIKAGNVLYFTTDLPSNWKNSGSTPAKLLWIIIND